MVFKIEAYVCYYHFLDDGQDILLPSIMGGKGTYEGKNIKMLYQHQPHQPIGVWHSFISDDIGLYGIGEVADCYQEAFSVSQMLDKGIVDGLSIGFVPQKFYHRKDGVRVLERILLKEVSVVTFPMQEKARIDKARIDQARIDQGRLIQNDLDLFIQ